MAEPTKTPATDIVADDAVATPVEATELIADSAPTQIGRTIARGASWTTAAQLTPLVVNVVLTPYVIRSFGLSGYGVFLLANTVVVFLGTFDGGLGPSVSRFAAVYAGNGDRASNTRLVTTLLLILVGLGTALFAVLFFLAGPILSLFQPPESIRADGIFLLKGFAVVLGILQVRNLFAAQLAAQQQYAWQSFVSIASYGVYAVGMSLTVLHDWGLRGATWTLIAQSLFALVLVLVRAIAFVDRRSLGLMPRAELREFLAYAGKVQITGLTAVVNQQADTFIVARLLSVSAVSVYGVGATFALQLRSVPLNVLGPMSTAIWQEYGRRGEASAVTMFTTLQRRWVQIATGWSSTAVAAVYFGVVSWLGPDFEEAGVVACILTAAYALHLWTGPLTALLRAVGRPGLEVRYAVVAAVLNIGFTIPLVLSFGLLGTVAGSGLGLVIGSLYYLRIAHSRYRDDLTSFLSEVPVAPAVVTVATVVLLELLLRPVVPSGGLGLVACGAIAAPGLLVYTACLLGPRTAVELVRVKLPSGAPDQAPAVSKPVPSRKHRARHGAPSGHKRN